MKEYKGLPGSWGCIQGKAVIIRPQVISVERREVDDPEREIGVLAKARRNYGEQLGELEHNAESCHQTDQAKILGAYLEILQDDVFFDNVKNTVKNSHACCSWALEEERSKTEAMFRKLDDPYLRARADDVNNVCHALMARLQGLASGDPFKGIEGDHLIVLADDLSPEDTVKLDRKRLAGMVTQRGGVTSHTVILAKALGIPAVVGVGNFLNEVKPGAQILLDGEKGTMVVDPDEKSIREFSIRSEHIRKQHELFSACESRLAHTEDGCLIHVDMNTGDQQSIANFDADRCDGVGLFRTEFLYIGQSDYPSEEFQFSIYKNMAKKSGDKELIIRTLDIGGDKQVSYMDLPKEPNPFLGYRAIRLCLDRKEVFLTQLRAILRASVFGNVKIMFPMIVNLEELEQAKGLLEKAKGQLDSKGLPYNHEIKVGIMVETPAAVLLSDQLACCADFFSIGSNDLTQYTTATDRQNELVQGLYTPFNISVLRAIKTACENAHKQGIPIGICGEAASEPLLVPMWVAIGIDELSVAPSLVGRTKYIIGRVSHKMLQAKAEEVLKCARISQAMEILRQMNRGVLPE